MATLNLGRIKPVFRGAYSGATAYVVDDIVTSSDETFICILASTGNATSNATYWTKLAAKGTDGTDGTDVGTTITTQGDILFRDGSGLQRLAKGTAAQALVMNAGATAPEWGSGGKNIKHTYVTNSTRATTTHNVTSRTAFWDFTFTKHYTNSLLYFAALFPYETEHAQYPHAGVCGLRLSTTNYDTDGSDLIARWGYQSNPTTGNAPAWAGGTFMYDTAGTNISGTGTMYARNFLNSNSGATISGFKIYNPKVSDDARGFDTYSYCTITEYEI